MMEFCPHCGNALERPLKNGISSCNNCERIFDSSTFNRILSAIWLIKRWHIDDAKKIELKTGLSGDEVAIALEYSFYTHEEILHALKYLLTNIYD